MRIILYIKNILKHFLPMPASSTVREIDTLRKQLFNIGKENTNLQDKMALVQDENKNNLRN